MAPYPAPARGFRAGLQSRYDTAEGLYRDRLLDEATHGLERYEPQFSARQVITRGQAFVFASLAIVAVLAFAVAPFAAGSVLTIGLGGWFLLNAAFRGLLFVAGATKPREVLPPPVGEGDLPLYSILVPMYREANVLPSLIRALSALDYPHDRLDIKLLLEADDSETIAALDEIDLDARFHVLRVPQGEPRTKPRACNYAFPYVPFLSELSEAV